MTSLTTPGWSKRMKTLSVKKSIGSRHSKNKRSANSLGKIESLIADQPVNNEQPNSINENPLIVYDLPTT